MMNDFTRTQFPAKDSLGHDPMFAYETSIDLQANVTLTIVVPARNVYRLRPS